MSSLVTAALEFLIGGVLISSSGWLISLLTNTGKQSFILLILLKCTSSLESFSRFLPCVVCLVSRIDPCVILSASHCLRRIGQRQLVCRVFRVLVYTTVR